MASTKESGASISTEQNSNSGGDGKTHQAGQADRTILGDAAASTYNDAVGYRSEGQFLIREYDEPSEDLVLLGGLRPTEENQHSIETILSRPVRLGTYTYKSGIGLGDDMFSCEVMDTLRTHIAFKLAREKLSGFYGIRFNAHLRVTLNPQPFEAGLFQIYFVPFENIVRSIPKTINSTECRLPFATGCNNVFCNIALQSDVELKVPYTGPTAFICLTNKLSQMGNFHVQNIVPITDSTNAASCELSIYLYFSDIELFGATPAGVMPQGISADVESTVKSLWNNPIRKSLTGLMDSLGLSKPVCPEVETRIAQFPVGTFPTCNSASTAVKYSAKHEQGLKIAQLGVDSKDEMEIINIISKPTYYDQWTWTTSQGEMTEVAWYPIEPNGHLLTNQGTETEALLYTPPTRLRYIANLFELWRGGIDFTFTVVSTKFHSGRLRFVMELGADKMEAKDIPYAFSQVVDIRDSAQFTIRCPFFACAPWRYIPQRIQYYDKSHNSIEYYSDAADSPFYERRNLLHVYVENQLRATANVAQSVSIVCQVSAAPDFEFAAPRSPISIPRITEKQSKKLLTHVDPQISDDYSASNDIPLINMVGTKPVNTSFDPTMFTVGEKITNLRELIKRPNLINRWKPKRSDSSDYILLPWFFENTENKIYEFSWLNYLWPLYRMWRGGVRYAFVTKEDSLMIFRYDPNFVSSHGLYTILTTVDPKHWTLSHGLGLFQIKTNGVTFLDGRSSNFNAVQPARTSLQAGHELEVPYYHRFHKCLTRPADETDIMNMATRHDLPPGVVYIELSYREDGEQSDITIFRSAADDFNFGYLLGAPLTSLDIAKIPEF